MIKVNADWSWLWKDWRVWMLLFIIVAVAILFLMTTSSSEVVQKTKYVAPVQQIDDSSSSSGSSLFNFLLVFALLVVVPIAMFSFRFFRRNMIVAVGMIIAAVFLYTRMWSSTFENNSTANVTQVSTTIDGVGSSLGGFSSLIVMFIVLGFIVAVSLKLMKMFR